MSANRANERDPRVLEKELREWDPEGFWKVTIWNRTRYIEVEIQAGSGSLAGAMALAALERDGENRFHLSVTETKRIG